MIDPSNSLNALGDFGVGVPTLRRSATIHWRFQEWSRRVNFRLNLPGMKKSNPALAIVIAVALTAAGTGLVKTVDPTSKPTPTKTETAASVANFINSMKQANSTPFVATYRLNGYLFFQDGTIVVAQIPSPLERKSRRMLMVTRAQVVTPTSFEGSPVESSSGSSSTPT